MAYQTQLHPWCIVRQLPEMPQTIIDRFHHYHDADARMQFLRRQTPNIKFSLCFAPSSAVGAKSAQ
jgi:hypothetical protein